MGSVTDETSDEATSDKAVTKLVSFESTYAMHMHIFMNQR